MVDGAVVGSGVVADNRELTMVAAPVEGELGELRLSVEETGSVTSAEEYRVSIDVITALRVDEGVSVLAVDDEE